MSDWRLLRTGRNSGAWNMAVDEAVMTCVARGLAPPTFRLYGWDPPALSLGRVQSFEINVDPEACARLGIGVVRRPTGGRAVLHESELTYSLVMSESDPALPRGVREAYCLAAEGIAAGLRLLGVDASIHSREPCQTEGNGPEGGVEGRTSVPARGHHRPIGPPGAGAPSGACFDTPSWYEVTVGGRKLVGSAQARMMGAFLQHGSILIDFDPARLCALLRFESDEDRAAVIEHLRAHAISLSGVLGHPVAFELVEDAVVAGMRDHIAPIELVEGSLLPEEIELAHELISRKYASPDWTIRRQAGPPSSSVASPAASLIAQKEHELAGERMPHSERGVRDDA